MKLKAYLEATGVTQVAFGKTIGASQSAVQMWASGERTPRPAMIRRIIQVTHGAVKAEDFLPDSECIEAAE